MNRLLSILFVFSVMAGSAFSSEEIKVRLQTKDTKIYIGTISDRAADSVVFRAKDGAPVRFTDAQIAYVQFPVNDDQEELIKRLSDEGEYSKLAGVLGELLLPYLPYVELPSNLTAKFLNWMIASYWAGDYDRVETLSLALERFGAVNNMAATARFYRMLALLEKGGFQTMETFLATPQASEIYPPDSAARLYIEARLAQHAGDYIAAVRSAARLMALHSRNADWMPQAELLCEELYFQLKMPESAEAVLADIKEFYTDPQVQEKAAAIAAVK